MRLLGEDLAVIAAAIALTSVPLIFGNYWTGLLTQALIFGGIAIGLDILVGQTGLPSLGHAAFFGLSGYGVAIGILRYDINPWLASGLGIVVSIAIGAAFAPLAVRMRGLAFLTIMLAFGQVWWGMATRGGKFPGGENGLPGVPRPSLGLSWWDLETTDVFYLFTLLCTAIVCVVVVLLAHSSLGDRLLGIRRRVAGMTTIGYH